MSATASDVFAARASTNALRPRHSLVVLLACNDLAMPPSYHDLDGIDVVAFRRGTRAPTVCRGSWSAFPTR
jgi:hypothetical protein